MNLLLVKEMAKRDTKETSLMEQEKVLGLIQKLDVNVFRFLKKRLEKKKREYKRKAAKRKKFLKSSHVKRFDERERLKLGVLPQMIYQAMSKGLPLREPKRKKHSEPEIAPLLYQTIGTSLLTKPLPIRNEEIPFELPFEPTIKYVPDMLYLQRVDADSTKMLVKMVVSWGFLEENRLTFFLNEKGEEISENRVLVFNADKTLQGLYPLRHASHFQNDDEETAKALFVSLMVNLRPNSRYFYRIECYDKKTKKLFAATNNIAFRTAFVLKEDNYPLFLNVSSDLHGGRGGKFLRGKVKGKIPTGNLVLAHVFNALATTEKEITFNTGYSISIATGDLTDNASYSEYWIDLFKRCSVLWNHVPLLTSIGNHDYYCGGRGRGNVIGGLEEDCRYFHRYISNPNSCSGNLPEHWYALELGNVFAIFLDTNGLGWGKYEIACGSEQWLWLEAELKNWRARQQNDPKTPQFCFVFLHSAIMSLGFWGRGFNSGNDEKAQSYLTPLFRKYGVDMVFCGHDHIYQRSTWMGTVYLENGRHGGTTRPFFYWKKRQAVYDIEKTCNNWNTRIYTTIYVPQNKAALTPEQQKRFEDFKKEVKKTLLEQPTACNYFFGTRKTNQKIGELFDRHFELKTKLVEDFILPKLEGHVWLRAYALESDYSPNKRELFDMAFVAPKTSNEIRKRNYVLSCPEKVVE